MVMCKNIWAVAKINFQRWKNDQRIWIIFISIGILLVQEVQSLTKYGLDVGEACTGYLLPILFHSGFISVGVIKTMLYLGCLLLLCDAPFIYKITPYIVSRSQRNCWWMGECLYMLLTTLLYIIFIVVISSMVVIPVSTYDDLWGGVIHGFAFGNTEMSPSGLANCYEFHLGIPIDTIGYLYPSGAQLYTFITVWASFFFLGLVQYLIGLVSKNKFLGFASASVLVFLDPILNELSIAKTLRWVQILSPVCWVSTDSLKLVNSENFLTIDYIISMFIILIVLFLLLIWIVSQKIMIDARGEI